MRFGTHGPWRVCVFFFLNKKILSDLALMDDDNFVGFFLNNIVFHFWFYFIFCSCYFYWFFWLAAMGHHTSLKVNWVICSKFKNSLELPVFNKHLFSSNFPLRKPRPNEPRPIFHGPGSFYKHCSMHL